MAEKWPKYEQFARNFCADWAHERVSLEVKNKGLHYCFRTAHPRVLADFWPSTNRLVVGSRYKDDEAVFFPQTPEGLVKRLKMYFGAYLREIRDAERGIIDWREGA